jgi:hypothetical protein
VRRSFRITGLVIAWLCANGAFLDVVQVFAWGRMFVGYARTLSIAEAAVQTFDPGKPCPICLAVRRARATEKRRQSAAVPTSVTKALLARMQNEPFILPLIRPEWPDADSVMMGSWLPPVPVPPPRTPIQLVVG